MLVQAVPATQEKIAWEQILPAPKGGTGYPASNPNIPNSFSKFNPDMSNVTPAADAPVIYDYTKTAVAGESIAIIGEYFTPNTRFIVYYQTASNEGVYLDARVQLIEDSRNVTITLPTVEQGLTARDMYAIWAITDKGASYPMFINKPEGWWVGPKNAAPGEKTSAFGTNFTKGNEKENDFAYIYLESIEGDDNMWVNVTNYNPNKVDFIVPKLPTGKYRVYVHSSNGGEYGFIYSGELNITVPKAWKSGKTFNVQNYEALGDGLNNDTSAIQAAMTAAANEGSWNTVYLPAGVYIIKGRLTGSANTRYIGAGKDKTFIIGEGNIDHMLYFSNADNIEISDMTFNSEAVTVTNPYHYEWHNNSYNIGVIYTGGNFKNSLMKNVDIYCPKGGSFFSLKTMFNWNNVIIEGCVLQGLTLKLIGNQVFFRDTLFIGRSDTEEMIHSWGSFDMVFEDCLYRDFNPVNDGVDADFCQRFFVENCSWGGSGNIYFGGNNFEGINPHKNSWMAGNAGEIILFESSLGKKLGYATNITSNTFDIDMHLTVGHFMDFVLLWTGEIYITSGTGAGQRRNFANPGDWNSNKYHGTIRVNSDWDVMPDETSYFVITIGTKNVALYDNFLSGETDYDRPSASTGVNFFSSTRNVVVAKNTLKDVRCGFTMYGSWYTEFDYDKNSFDRNIVPGIGFIRNCLFADNNIYFANSGMLYMYHDFTNPSVIVEPEKIYQFTNGANVVRSNSFTNITQNGICAASGGVADNANNIFEKNYIADAKVGLSLNSWETNSYRTWKGLFYNNTFERRFADESGSRAIHYAREKGMYDVNLKDNTFTGYSSFATIETSVIPGAKLEVPDRLIKAISVDDSIISSSIELWNVGLGNLSWTAQTDTPWLTIENESGTIGGQIAEGSDTGILEIKCDPDKMRGNKGTGVVQISALDRTIDVIVEFYTGDMAGISMKSEPVITQYILGQELDLTGAKLNVNFNEGPTQVIDITQDMVSGYNKDTEGIQEITVEYEGFTTKFEVFVSDLFITEIKMASLPDKTKYYIGEELDLTGAALTLVRADGNEEDIEVTANMVRGFNSSIVGEITITVSYLDLTTEFTVEIAERSIRKKGFIVDDGTKDNISIADAILIFRHLAGKIVLTGADEWAADVDGKNGITVQDAIHIFRYLAGKMTMEELQALHLREDDKKPLIQALVDFAEGQNEYFKDLNTPELTINCEVRGDLLVYEIKYGSDIDELEAGEIPEINEMYETIRDLVKLTIPECKGVILECKNPSGEIILLIGDFK